MTEVFCVLMVFGLVFGIGAWWAPAVKVEAHSDDWMAEGNQRW